MWFSKNNFGTALALCSLLTTITTTALHAQKTDATKSTVAQQLALIRQHYDAIDSPTKKYTIRKRKTVNHDPIGDGRDRDYTGYYEKNQLRKIVVQDYGDHGSDTFKYYFWQGKLFFVDHTAIGYYDLPRTNGVRWEHRLYFAEGQMIRWLGDKNVVQTLDTPAARQTAIDTLDASREAIALLNAPPLKSPTSRMH